MKRNIELDSKINQTINYIKNLGSVIVAFSGGVDSSLLLKLVLKSDVKYLAVTFHSYLYSDSEIDIIKKFVTRNNINHKIIYTDPFKDITSLTSNPADRCYSCKHYLYNELITLKNNIGFDNILDGTNYDDQFIHRPGKLAVRELNILSPLALFKFTKTDIRNVAKSFDMQMYNKPSLSCYLTRFQYDTSITIDMIDMIRSAEDFIHNLGLSSARCRVHNEFFLRLEFDDNDMLKAVSEYRDIITGKMKSFGFKYITLDMQGYITGSMDR